MHCLRGLDRSFTPLAFLQGEGGQHALELGAGGVGHFCLGTRAQLAATDIVMQRSCAGRFLG